MQNGLTELTHQEMQAQHPTAYNAWCEGIPPKHWHRDDMGILHAESADGWPFVWDPASGEWDAM